MSAGTSSEIFDSLPYYDDDLQKYPNLQDKVNQELARELQKLNPSNALHPRVPPPVELFADDPLLKAELDRARASQPLPSLDTLRYQLPAPSSMPASDEEWRAALDNACSQLQHQRIRLVAPSLNRELQVISYHRHTNAALLQNYGANAWKIQNYLLEATVKQVESVAEQLKQSTVEVNRGRKNDQERIGKQLTSLETRWTELISNILQIEMANIALDVEVDQLTKKEAELAQQI